MIEEAHDEGGSHVWMIFGDLMAGVLGLFALFLVWAVLFQVDLAADLAQAEAAAAKQTQRLEALETALAEPLKAGRITLVDGRIGIAGSVLFDLYSDELRPEGRQLLRNIAAPLAAFLRTQDEMVMVGGFTDDLPITGDKRKFDDNWQLSTERALTVVRALSGAGLPPARLFAAGFGAHHPSVPNEDEATRARNRRVEIVPVPRDRRGGSGPQSPAGLQ